MVVCGVNAKRDEKATFCAHAHTILTYYIHTIYIIYIHKVRDAIVLVTALCTCVRVYVCVYVGGGEQLMIKRCVFVNVKIKKKLLKTNPPAAAAARRATVAVCIVPAVYTLYTVQQ